MKAKSDHAREALRAFVLAGIAALCPSVWASSALPSELTRDVSACTGKIEVDAACAKAIEARAVQREGARFQRKKERLYVHTATKVLEFVDVQQPEDQLIWHSYLAWIPSIQVHVLRTSHYEGGGWIVVHHPTGRLSRPIGYPFVSPDAKRFYAASEDMFAGYEPNGLEVWTIRDMGIERESFFDLDWGPRSGKWRGPNQIELEKYCYDEKSKTLLSHCGKAKFIFQRGDWRVAN